ncbi:MAG: UBP-type zinc finger domain-containing protein [Actinomycetota bacterium]
MADPICTHMDQVKEVQPEAAGCGECLKTGDSWVNLRMCMSCGNIGCCNDSKNRHAMKHFQATEHPIVQSYEPGQDWWWCWVDEATFEVEGAPSYSHP